MALVKHRKVVMLGFPAVGKTALVAHFVKGVFPEEYEPTYENTWRKTFAVGSDEFELDIVDTAGHYEYSLIHNGCVFGIHGYIVVYSVDCERSFEIAQVLHKYLVDLHGKCPIPLLLVANKSDLPPHSRKVKYEEGKKLADSWEAAFMEVSAKDPEESKQIFTKIINEIDRVENTYGREDKCCFM
uniref:Rheb n=1 Tax=Leptobrachium leishanense TaxID=445787 RepID=A0A8C5MZU7_9ANUR